METGKGTEVPNLDELNLQDKAEMLKLIDRDEKQDETTRTENLSIAERMMRRAKTNTFTLAFVDTKNDDEIEIEFRLLYSKERRDLLNLINNIQGITDGEEVDLVKFNSAFESLRELVKNVTVDEGMNTYYDSDVCQDGDIFEIAMSVMGRTVQTVEQARQFREKQPDAVLP